MSNAEIDGDTSMDQDFEHPEHFLEGWSKREKFCLLQGIKIFGSNAYEEISEMVRDKDKTEIKRAIDFYKRKIAKAVATLPPVKKKKEHFVCNPPNKSVPLSSWAKTLTDNLPFQDLQTETATALRFIADYETIPDARRTGNIDFRELYRTLADAVEGKALSKNTETMAIIQKCLLETAFDSRLFIKTSKLETVLEQINLIGRTEKFVRPSSNYEMAIIHHLSSQRSYNPLGIPEEYLRPSTNNNN